MEKNQEIRQKPLLSAEELKEVIENQIQHSIPYDAFRLQPSITVYSTDPCPLCGGEMKERTIKPGGFGKFRVAVKECIGCNYRYRMENDREKLIRMGYFDDEII